MALNDIGIDLGTTSVIIYMEGKGIVLNEPTVVAVDTDTGKVLEVGEKAYNMIGRTPAHITAVRPLKDGVISDYVLTRELVKRFVTKVSATQMVKPRVAVCVPAALTGIESDAAKEAVVAAGARQIFLIDEPIAAAIGSGLDITRPGGNIVVDIGGGTTDIAVISLGGKVQSTSVKIAGNTLDREIVKHLRMKFHLLVGEKSAELLKRQVACADRELDYNSSAEIKGRSLDTGLPVRCTVTTADLYEPVCACVEELTEAVHGVLSRTPPELAGDIFERGIMLTGGGALLRGLDSYMSRTLKLGVRISDEPINCVAIGTGKSIELKDELESGFMDVTPRPGRR